MEERRGNEGKKIKGGRKEEEGSSNVVGREIKREEQHCKARDTRLLCPSLFS